MRKLWQETRDPGCKKAVNWALEWWETKLANTELTSQTIWPIAKSLTNKDGPKASTAIHGLLGLKYPVDKANVIAD
jgi:hypothetical protein